MSHPPLSTCCKVGKCLEPWRVKDGVVARLVVPARTTTKVMASLHDSLRARVNWEHRRHLCAGDGSEELNFALDNLCAGEKKSSMNDGVPTL
ncbi:hypothetical protein M404DRAFT_1000848 [Pisolithus tinctorius Marx 270]|uniref:Uncharacterized protein n=1 Tax=Pisolithus tinctorius Marx 270 TaxID=870435 RepID=A0A0C3NGK1_PISTI|nr:hypothetical protein M404DRAFT_1008222 [Pisolithus tinctorius Marx 270]KIO04023.1 hypothetical protein M404DRAFT_1000848 [Pisolithus tinctorius Marx 270]